jgi:hypothetical protein
VATLDKGHPALPILKTPGMRDMAVLTALTETMTNGQLSKLTAIQKIPLATIQIITVDTVLALKLTTMRILILDTVKALIISKDQTVKVNATMPIRTMRNTMQLISKVIKYHTITVALTFQILLLLLIIRQGIILNMAVREPM